MQSPSQFPSSLEACQCILTVFCLVGELCFDISRFNSTNFRVSTFVESLISHGGTRKLAYEHTLRYVEFPPLDTAAADRETFKESSHFEHEHNEVFKVLKWLGDKGVKSIVKLRIPDRLINPHNDREMAIEVDRFEVEVLDWKVPDLSISIFNDNVKSRIKELYLYASGNRAVISHWFSSEGIRSLEKLERLEIKIVQETCTLRNSVRLLDDIDAEISELRKSYPETFKAQVEVTPWYPTPRLADLNEIGRRVAPKLARWLQNLEVVVKRKKREGNFTPTKVAILDTGILSISPVSNDATRDGTTASNGTKDQSEESRSVWSRIEDGRSFVDDNSRLSPWLFASDPHGTQMANLICAIDPFSVIYVARVAEDSFGIKSERVAKAIEWARSKKVDVISMSFVFGDENKGVIDEITKATDEGIVMTCSTHDEGSRIVDAYPASWMGKTLSLIVLAACNDYGKLLRDVDPNQYHYKLNGQDVAAGIIPFLKSEDTISGSSVSTALAAGLCSLILTCDRLANPHKAYEKGTGERTRLHLVKHHLDNMQSSTNSQFVMPEKFGDIDTPHIGQARADGSETGRIGVPSAHSVLRKHFGM
ncbi:peptidase S8/S53 domain-containing protein, partial [Hypoxylon sp. FL1284]